MSRRRGKSLSPSLFPFLAVLVCTLGTLILLLALVAQNAAETAEQQARAEAQRIASEEAKPPADRPPRLTAASAESLLTEERFRVEQLITHREQQTAELEQQRDQLTHLEDHIQRLRDQLQQISREIEQTLDQKPDTSGKEEQLAQLKKQIEDEKKNLEQLRASADDQSPRFVIVPHQGPNGTDRRPVYLECDADGIVLWPEGSRITRQQLEASTQTANPLDAALRTVRLHAMKHYGDDAPPYPLLVVRPEGIETYAAARQAMTDWDDQFGYELVPADLKLAYDQPDRELKERIDLAIQQAAQRQEAIHRLAIYGGGRGGYAGSAVRGGRLPVLSAAEMDRAGRRSGFHSGDRYGIQRDPYGSYRSTGAPSSADRSYAGNPSYSGTHTGGTHGGSGNGTVASRPSPGGNGEPNSPAIDAARMRDLDQQMRTAAEELRERSKADGSLAVDSAPSEADLITGSGILPSGAGILPSESGAAVSTTAGDRSATSSLSQNNLDERSLASAQEADESVIASDLRTSAGNHSSETQTSADGISSLQTRNSFGQAASEAKTAGQGGPSSARAFSASPSGGMQSFSSISPTPPQPSRENSFSSPRDQSYQRATTSSPSSASGQTASSNTRLTRSGDQWALPDHMRGVGGNAIVRMIRAECDAEQFVLWGSGDAATEVYGLSSGDVEEASIRIATAIHDRIERWGPALPGGRWQPTLEVIVKAGGETRFHRLQSLLDRSGIDVVGRRSR